MALGRTVLVYGRIYVCHLTLDPRPPPCPPFPYRRSDPHPKANTSRQVHSLMSLMIHSALTRRKAVLAPLTPCTVTDRHHQLV
ncbi:hypothetical protein E2C01_024405 [Portunus trituberculatus]|uniref:Uncharacterized protein n=1 Tax=Portunus trituberculatus TaxID=210409 RepID=A0A5B7ED30_PORTR|nr:hypothetical protein [Portunus trituberculatus]